MGIYIVEWGKIFRQHGLSRKRKQNSEFYVSYMTKARKKKIINRTHVLEPEYSQNIPLFGLNSHRRGVRQQAIFPSYDTRSKPYVCGTVLTPTKMDGGISEKRSETSPEDSESRNLGLWSLGRSACRWKWGCIYPESWKGKNSENVGR